MQSSGAPGRAVTTLRGLSRVTQSALRDSSTEAANAAVISPVERCTSLSPWTTAEANTLSPPSRAFRAASSISSCTGFPSRAQGADPGRHAR